MNHHVILFTVLFLGVFSPEVTFLNVEFCHFDHKVCEILMNSLERKAACYFLLLALSGVLITLFLFLFHNFFFIQMYQKQANKQTKYVGDHED